MLSALLLAATAIAAAPPPFTWPAPEGWKMETIPFPLEFAPELTYKGLEELRFPPGMFKATDEYFSYAFVWWLDGSEGLDAPALSRALQHYFEGLARAVEKKPDFKADEAKATVYLNTIPNDPKHFKGTAKIYDAFAVHGRVTLNIRVERSSCEAAKKQVVMFLMSPKAETHATWKKLESVAAGFKCPPATPAK